jgi:SAM-dependent methyltransferase
MTSHPWKDCEIDKSVNSKIAIPKLPPPDIYDQEYDFWPWGRLIARIENWVVENAPPRAFVVDYMCGTGFLLGGIAKRRPDLHLCGCSLVNEYVDYGKANYPTLTIDRCDCMAYTPKEEPDVVICTGGIHHLPPTKQRAFVEKVASETKCDGYLLVGEEVIREYGAETERRLAALELGSELVASVIRIEAPDSVVEAAVDLIKRDLFEAGEYKTSLGRLEALLSTAFVIENSECVWPSREAGFGDYFMVCRLKSATSQSEPRHVESR